MLDSIWQEIERLRERMNKHRAALSANETMTRNVLVDPMLRLLGWDTTDPARVLPEYRFGSERVDYALCHDGEPVALIEAKSLDTRLTVKDLEQLGKYSYYSGVRWGVITDGNEWQVIDGHQMSRPIDQRCVLWSTVSEGPVHLVLQVLLALCPGNLTSSAPRFLALEKTPTVPPFMPPGPPVGPPVVVTPPPADLPQPEPAETVAKPPSSAASGTLPDLAAARATPGSRPPGQLIFADGTTAAPRRWADLLQAVVEWLVQSQRLTTDRLPLADAAGKKRYLINTAPEHADGKPFWNPREAGPGIFYHANYNSAVECCRNAVHTLVSCGVDPETVRWQAE